MAVPPKYCRISGPSKRKRKSDGERDDSDDEQYTNYNDNSPRPEFRRSGILHVTEATHDPSYMEDGETSADSPCLSSGKSTGYQNESGRRGFFRVTASVDRVVFSGGYVRRWLGDISNDEQLGRYRGEYARKPREDTWESWHAPWAQWVRPTFLTTPPSLQMA